VSKLFSPRQLFVAIFALVVCSALAAQEEFDQAEFFFSHRLYDEAITEYLRFLFFHQADGRVSVAYEKIARSYIELGNWQSAEKNIRSAIDAAKTDPARVQERFFLVEFLLAQGRYTESLDQLDTLGSLKLAQEESRKRLFLSGVAEVYLHKWEEAAGYFTEYFKNTNTYSPETQHSVLALLRFGVEAYYKDPLLARVLSYIVPGSGQIYAGDLAQGINSLLVTGLAGALVVWAIVEGAYPDAVAAAFFIFQRFYFGSPFNAERIAKQYNDDKKNAIAGAVFELLLK
jgi:tetratricopeptide (TPR) repeat protein